MIWIAVAAVGIGAGYLGRPWVDELRLLLTLYREELNR